MSHTKLRAFTLVELLVVIGIISVLIAILLPALNRARGAAQTIACASNMRQVMQGLIMYANDNHGSLPYCYQPIAEHGGAWQMWGALIAGTPGSQYIKDIRAMYCPSRAGEGLMPGIAQHITDLRNDGAEPWDYGTSWAYWSYSANLWGAMPQSIMTGHTVKIGQPGLDPTTLLVLTEGYRRDFVGVYGNGLYEVQPGGVEDIYVHSGGVTNCAFLDGHVVSLPAGDLGWDVNANRWKPNMNTIGCYNAPWFRSKYTQAY